MTEQVLAAHLRKLLPAALGRAVAGQYSLAAFQGDDGTPTAAVLFVPPDEVAAVQAFISARCRSAPNSSELVVFNNEDQ